MNHFRTATAIVLLVLLFIVGSYWLLMLIRKDLISALPADSDDSFGHTGLQETVKDAFEPVRELDLQITHDRPLQRFLTGEWRCEAEPYIERFALKGVFETDGSKDFVEIKSDGSCRFQLGEFQYQGRVAYDRDYAGYFVEFPHEDRTHIFIFSPDRETWTEEPPNRLAVAFVGHDPKPEYREIDYRGIFTRRSAESKASDHENENAEQERLDKPLPRRDSEIELIRSHYHEADWRSR